MKSHGFAPFFVIHNAISPTIQAPKQFLDIHGISIDVEGMKLLLKGGK
jgi:hypothetical protein